MKNNKWATSFLAALNSPENQKKIKTFRAARSLWRGNKDKYNLTFNKMSEMSEVSGWIHYILEKSDHNWRYDEYIAHEIMHPIRESMDL